MAFVCETCSKPFCVSRSRLNYYAKRGTRMPRFCSHACKGTTLNSFLAMCDASRGPDSCWLWLGGVSAGYGTVSINGQPTRSNRASWLLHKGPIPDGLVVCHECDTPLCVNPAHLFLGTHNDNNQDKVIKGRQTCGEAVANSILNADQVEEIRSELARGEKGRRLAERYGVSPSTVSAIKAGRIWNSRSASYALGM